MCEHAIYSTKCKTVQASVNCIRATSPCDLSNVGHLRDIKALPVA